MCLTGAVGADTPGPRNLPGAEEVLDVVGRWTYRAAERHTDRRPEALLAECRLRRRAREGESRDKPTARARVKVDIIDPS